MTEPVSAILAAAMIAAGYITIKCATPPNTSQNRHNTDRVSLIVTLLPSLLPLVSVGFIYHALLTILPSYAPTHIPQLCPGYQTTNTALFTWNATTASSLAAIFVGGYIRLGAYSGLGRSFTFHLAAPDHLITDGIYRWIQHPSYVGLGLIVAGCEGLFLRWDATPACWLGEDVLARLDGWGVSVDVGALALSIAICAARVKDEEDMLRGQFGKEWEAWHRETKRFIPGIF
ncbi:Phospholipid methyltransferase [Penicillium riverlandense]|uniref:Phospholipid methyltransferase n=1 Tax=Penicillium riverlandense TaxID=1903569 RepID=UPI002548A884|nr:Phospholipid methyltransferase [Penicillium riverlandense]KAJ5825374.1 Phospholipid methyltransferase [Penicillium riverlandense]